MLLLVDKHFNLFIFLLLNLLACSKFLLIKNIFYLVNIRIIMMLLHKLHFPLHDLLFSIDSECLEFKIPSL